MNTTRTPPTILSVRCLGAISPSHPDVAGVASESKKDFQPKIIFLGIFNRFSFYLDCMREGLSPSIDR